MCPLESDTPTLPTGAEPEAGIRAVRAGRVRDLLPHAGALALRVGARGIHWAPVLVALVLFGQVAILGLRPALCESRRLAEADVVLQERHARAVALNQELSAQLAARQDPIYRERQRRMRAIRATPSVSPVPSEAATESSSQLTDG